MPRVEARASIWDRKGEEEGLGVYAAVATACRQEGQRAHTRAGERERRWISLHLDPNRPHHQECYRWCA